MLSLRLRRVPVLLLSACTVLLSGCFPGARPPYLVEQYTLDYAPPVCRSASRSGGGGRQVLGGPNLQQPRHGLQGGPYRVAVLYYHKWRTNPGDMVTDDLLRDFRASGLFRAVFCFRRPEGARFVVEGGIEEFLESREGGGQMAVLGLEVTLHRSEQGGAPRKGGVPEAIPGGRARDRSVFRGPCPRHEPSHGRALRVDHQ